jgi:hypothetical protein
MATTSRMLVRRGELNGYHGDAGPWREERHWF